MRVYEVKCETVWRGATWSDETYHVQASNIKTAIDRALRAHKAEAKREGTSGTHRVISVSEVDIKFVV